MKNIRAKSKKYEEAKKVLRDACIKKIIELARGDIERGIADNFTLAMGTWFFKKADDILYNYKNSKIECILDEFDHLHLSGEGIRVTKNEIVTHW